MATPPGADVPSRESTVKLNPSAPKKSAPGVYVALTEQLQGPAGVAAAVQDPGPEIAAEPRCGCVSAKLNVVKKGDAPLTPSETGVSSEVSALAGRATGRDVVPTTPRQTALIRSAVSGP